MPISGRDMPTPLTQNTDPLRETRGYAEMRRQIYRAGCVFRPSEDPREVVHALLIPGTSSVAHLRENATGAGLTLTDEDLAELDEIGN